jgi:hypothetical protein
VSKLRYSGFDWLDGETLAFYLGGGSLRNSGLQGFIGDPSLPPAARFRDGYGLVDYAWVASPPAFARALSDQPLLMIAGSCLVLLFELTFPLALLSRRWMKLYVWLAIAFHLGVYALMRIDFAAYAVSYTLFVDWRGLWRRAQRAALPQPAPGG